MCRYPSSSAQRTASTHSCAFSTCQTPSPSIGIAYPSASSCVLSSSTALRTTLELLLYSGMAVDLTLGSFAQHLRLRRRCAELEASGRGVREGVIENLQRRLMLVEHELEVVVARGISDGDRHQIRRSTPKQSHRDAVAL